MDGIPNIKNIRVLLHEGFSLSDLINLCFYETKLNPVYDNWAEVDDKNEFIRKMIDYAEKQLIVDLMLRAAKEKNPQRFEQHKPYYYPAPAPATEVRKETPGVSVGTILTDNNLGKGILLGGVYQNTPLRIVAQDWVNYGSAGFVRSGWLFLPQWTSSHAVAFFKAHVLTDGTGYIHLADVSDPVHTIWLETSDGLKIEKEFHYVGHPVDVWHF